MTQVYINGTFLIYLITKVLLLYVSLAGLGKPTEFAALETHTKRTGVPASLDHVTKLWVIRKNLPHNSGSITPEPIVGPSTCRLVSGS